MIRVLGAAVAGLLLVPGVASAHGDVESSAPRDGAAVRRVPGRVVLRLTEPPGPGSTMKVADGCKRDIASRVVRDGSALVATVERGQPGRWHASFRGVSSVDGHVTRGGVRFTVRGPRDCRDKDKIELGGGDGTQIEAEASEEGGGIPIVPIAIGSLILVGLALLLRRLSSG